MEPGVSSPTIESAAVPLVVCTANNTTLDPVAPALSPAGSSAVNDTSGATMTRGRKRPIEDAVCAGQVVPDTPGVTKDDGVNACTAKDSGTAQNAKRQRIDVGDDAATSATPMSSPVESDGAQNAPDAVVVADGVGVKGGVGQGVGRDGVGIGDLPVEAADMILSLLVESKDFDACLDSCVFSIDTNLQRVRRRIQGVKKRQLITDSDLEALRYIDERRGCRFRLQDVSVAVATGNLKMVRWIWKRASVGHPHGALSSAVRGGNLDILKWLCKEIQPPLAKVDSLIRCAASTSHNAIVVWLCEHYNRPGVPAALLEATTAGDLNTLRYLYERCADNARYLYDSDADEYHPIPVGPASKEKFERLQHTCRGLIDTACLYGHYGLVTYMWDNEVGLCTYRILRYALEGEDSRLVEFVWRHRKAIEARVSPWSIVDPATILKSSVSHCKLTNVAVCGGHLTSLLMLRHLFDIKPTARALTKAALWRHEHMVDYLLDQCKIAPTADALTFACRHGDVYIAQRLLQSGITCTVGMMGEAVIGGYVALVQMLQAKTIAHCSANHICTAALRGHLDVLKAIDLNEIRLAMPQVMENAIINGHLRIVRYITKECELAITNKSAMLKRAAVLGHFKVVRYLHEHLDCGIESRHLFHVTKVGYFKIARYMAARVGAPWTRIQDAFEEAIRHAEPDLAEAIRAKIPAPTPHRGGDLAPLVLADAVDPNGALPVPAPPVLQPVQDTAVDDAQMERLYRVDSIPKDSGATAVRTTLDRVCALVSGKIDWANSALATNAIGDGCVETLKWLHEHQLLERCGCELSSAITTAITTAIHSDHLRVVEWLYAHGFRADKVPARQECWNATSDLVRSLTPPVSF